MTFRRRIGDGTKVITPEQRFDRIDQRLNLVTLGVGALLALHAQEVLPLLRAAGALGILGGAGFVAIVKATL
jgi:hypothetical protein